MSYFFVIVGTRDNPLYTADLASKPSTSSGAASFFSSSSSSSSSNTSSSLQAGSGAAGQDEQSHAGGGGIFGFGGSLGLGALAGGLSSRSSAPSGAAQQSASSAAAGAGAGEGTGIGFGRYNDRHVLQMIAHSSLDVVEDRQFAPQWAGGGGSGGGGGGASGGAAPMYMKSVDRINEWTTSAFLVPGNIKFLILHEHKHDDGIRNFFLDIWELWVKLIQNPFHDLNAPIPIPSSFDTKVRASARKHL